MAHHIRAYRRRNCYYIRGIDRRARTVSEVLEADSKDAARKKFGEKYPHTDIIQVNKREC